MKYFSLILITMLLFVGCNSDENDNTEQPSSENKTLVLKKITTKSFEANYNKEGRLDNQRIDGQDFVKISYNANNKIHKWERVGNPKISYEFFYDANRLIGLELTMDNINRQQETQKFELEYMDNSMILKKTDNQNSELIAVHTFEDGNFTKLKSYKIIDTTTDDTTYEERYKYDKENVITNTFPIGSPNPIDRMYTMEYDDNPNPYAESNSVDYLNYILVKTAFGFPNQSSLMRFELPEFSQNNLLTSYVENTTIKIEYNEKNYPIKMEDINDNGEVINTRLYEYY